MFCGKVKLTRDWSTDDGGTLETTVRLGVFDGPASCNGSSYALVLFATEDCDAKPKVGARDCD